jgi:glycerol-3-phosphate acyltransferase PlsY
VTTIIALVIAYLIGSVDFGVIVPRILGIDIYEHGSGNPGTSNVFRSVGKGAAAVVLVGDALKGVVAAVIGSTLGGETVGFAAALAAVLGHAFPVWHGFKGGRGVATAVGAAIWLAPVYGTLLAVGWFAAVAVTKTASVASLVAMVLYVPAMALGGHRGTRLVLAGAIALVVILRHAPNIKRIFTGSEQSVVRE